MLSFIVSVDLSVTSALYALATSSPVFSLLAVFVAQWLPYCAIIFLVVYEFLVDDDPRTVVPARLRRVLLPVLLVWIIVVGMKLAIHEPRPFVGDLDIVPLVGVVDPFSSFPSAHAAIFAALFGSLLAFHVPFWRWYGLIALAVGVGRVMTGVHWPSDVLVGFFLGFVVSFSWGRVVMFQQEKNI